MELTKSRKSGWNQNNPFGLVKITCLKSINSKRRILMSVKKLKKRLTSESKTFKEFKENFNALVEEIDEAQRETGRQIVQLNGWNSFQGEDEHYFMTCSQEDTELVKNTIEENIENARITENIDRRGRMNLNIYMT